MVKYKVTLTQEEREELEGIISKGKHSSQVVPERLYVAELR